MRGRGFKTSTGGRVIRDPGISMVRTGYPQLDLVKAAYPSMFYLDAP
jgi:hypothetical protein